MKKIFLRMGNVWAERICMFLEIKILKYDQDLRVVSLI